MAFESDTDPGHNLNETRRVDEVDNLVFSVRLNAGRLVRGLEAVGRDWEGRGGEGEELRIPYDTGSPFSREVLDGFT